MARLYAFKIIHPDTRKVLETIKVFGTSMVNAGRVAAAGHAGLECECAGYTELRMRTLNEFGAP